MAIEDSPARDAGQPGLRERRRRETRRELVDAAIELFERKGVQATTSEDIAEAAGVSARTFFRYAATKESAVFLDDDEYDDIVPSGLDGALTESSAIAAIERGVLDSLARFDAQPPESHLRTLRLRRLIIAEPSLLALALARDEAHLEKLTSAVTSAVPDTDDLRARTLVTAIGTNVRLSFDEWARRTEGGGTAQVRELYAEIRHALAGYFSASS